MLHFISSRDERNRWEMRANIMTMCLTSFFFKKKNIWYWEMTTILSKIKKAMTGENKKYFNKCLV